MILYNLHSSGDEYRISKFNDGELESSYLLTAENCDCPAGHHFTCRHRKMLPAMLAAGIANTHWFWDRETSLACDLNGVLKPIEAEGPMKTESTPVTYGGQTEFELVAAPRKPWRRI